MNFSSVTVASGGMATRKPYPSDVSDEEWAFVAPPRAPQGGRPPTRPRSARGVQRVEMGGSYRLPVALHAPRLATVGGRLPADAAVAKGGSVRGDGPRFARTFTAFGGSGIRAYGGHT